MTHDVPRGTVLIVSDETVTGQRLTRWATEAGEQVELVALDPGRAVDPLSGIDTGRVDLIVTDLDPDSPEAVRLLRRLLDEECLPGVPQLHVMRDAVTLRRLNEVGGRGATLTIPANPDEALFRTRVTLAAEVGRLRRAMSHATIRDPLTGTFNRRFLSLRLDQEFARARRYRTPLSIVLFSLDQLRAINEGFGQRAGDRSLASLTELLRGHVRREDTFGRWGTKIFAVLLPGTAHRGAATFANYVRSDVEAARVETPDGALPLRVSVGIASFGAAEESHSAAEMVRAAELALTEARRRGGNRVHIDEASASAEGRTVLVLERDAAWLDVIEDLLGLEELHVTRAGSVSAAVAAVDARRPDLMILDTGFLDAEPGALDAIRSAAPDTHLPVIAIAAANGDGAAPSGADRFLTRPFSAGVLPTLARELIDRSRAAGAHLRAV